MAQSSPSTYRSATCHMTYGTMGHIDLEQPSPRSLPWDSIKDQTLISKVDLIAPNELYNALQEQVLGDKLQPIYYRAAISLAQLVHDRYFLDLIQDQNMAMMCESNLSFSSRYAIVNGILTMHLDKETFERAGIPGRSPNANTCSTGQARRVISVDLKNLASPQEKRVYERLVHACESLFIEKLGWLICLDTGSMLPPDLLEKYQGQQCSMAATILKRVIVSPDTLNITPSTLLDDDRASTEEKGIDLYEWLSMARLGSPRIGCEDAIDPYLSRYSLASSGPKQLEVCKISWQGFIGTAWFRDLTRDLLAACPRQSWISITAISPSGAEMDRNTELTLLRPSGSADQYLMWQI